MTLLAFIGHAIRHIRSKQETDEGLLEAVSLLLELATTDENTPTDSVEIVAAAQWALSEVLLTISAVDFVKVVSTMLRSTDKKVCKLVIIFDTWLIRMSRLYLAHFVS